MWIANVEVPVLNKFGISDCQAEPRRSQPEPEVPFDVSGGSLYTSSLPRDHFLSTVIVYIVQMSKMILFSCSQRTQEHTLCAPTCHIETLEFGGFWILYFLDRPLHTWLSGRGGIGIKAACVHQCIAKQFKQNQITKGSILSANVSSAVLFWLLHMTCTRSFRLFPCVGLCIKTLICFYSSPVEQDSGCCVQEIVHVKPCHVPLQ